MRQAYDYWQDQPECTIQVRLRLARPGSASVATACDVANLIWHGIGRRRRDVIDHPIHLLRQCTTSPPFDRERCQCTAFFHVQNATRWDERVLRRDKSSVFRCAADVYAKMRSIDWPSNTACNNVRTKIHLGTVRGRQLAPPVCPLSWTRMREIQARSCNNHRYRPHREGALKTPHLTP